MKRGFAIFYAILNTLCLIGGCVLVFYFAWKNSIPQTVGALLSLVVSFMLAPLFHELGHLIFARAQGMECVYFKAFCFRFTREEGRGKFSFASPFSADETQVIPKYAGNMKKRVKGYAVGGLIFGGLALLVLCSAAVITTVLSHTQFWLWGAVPYFAYLFFLNLLPVEYASGKTDMLVLRGIKKEESAEKNMLSAMEIQGFLYEGKSFSEIPERLFFDLPQLCEDEPLFAVMLDLRYRYYLEKNQLQEGADCLNRLAQAQYYLPDSEVEKIAAELTYLHSLNGDFERAEDCGKLCENYLRGNTVTAKRILAAFSNAFGKRDAVAPLKAQAEECLKKERIKGLEKFERILLGRIDDGKNAQTDRHNV